MIFSILQTTWKTSLNLLRYRGRSYSNFPPFKHCDIRISTLLPCKSHSQANTQSFLHFLLHGQKRFRKQSLENSQILSLQSSKH